MSTPPADRGSTTVAERAVRRIAERAATEALAPGEVRVHRGSAAVRGRRARVGVAVTLPYPAVLDEAGERVRSHVADRTAGLTGLAVPSARVRVRELRVRERAEGTGTLAPKEASQEVPGGGRARRPWSQRRLPVAVLAFVGAALCGLFLYDVVSVHAAGRSPARWRTRLMEWLATHGPDSGAWPGAAIAAAVFLLGVVLLVVAVTPGRRRLLPVAGPDAGIHAVIDRSSVASLLRDAVAEVPGVTRVRVRVGRRRARVRAGLGFGSPATARRAVADTARETLAACGLARPLRLKVRVRTEPAWRAPAPSAAKSTPVAAGSMPRSADEPTP
ncbi:Asp23/Gls24 family envelope stress response protein [Streptomyces sp. BG9H]|uniref:Asp23/Gls24 family envelope stress response protein n=1 Tax=Streptomyces anatolicus TaxID=2675858 RepID=A0ABS6YPV7_9ACTN|nr:DUF6286 domain-containing protein [Streptomyces anatolicus]MBW5423467.1 Asp23/Gls24 family envelope stress response protein [Streptomyces anatolicus]